MPTIAFIDIEVGRDNVVLDLGAICDDGTTYHGRDIHRFIDHIDGCTYLCGHNIVEHDMRYIKSSLRHDVKLIDTLYLSPILFPNKPYHRLVKDDKLLTYQSNDPLNDSLKAKILFEEEIEAFNALPAALKNIYFYLLADDRHFSGFFSYIGVNSNRAAISPGAIISLIHTAFAGKICKNAPIDKIISAMPVQLAYALALISTSDITSLTPPWVYRNYPSTTNIMRALTAINCTDASCEYCRANLDPTNALRRWFGYDEFRTFNGGEPLQENAVKAAMDGRSLLVVFPTGGGKSLTFQLPALVTASTCRELTVVISPLQSLMKDQVDNLERRGIVESVYINGLLSPIERANALNRLMSGDASILYISPEQLRSTTIERVLMSRIVARVVIDEAHCFSAWGQDFRTDYMFIGQFLNNLQQKKGLLRPIPVSCFTATAKPKVISDIIDYFRRTTGVMLTRFTTSATRKNLHYTVLYKKNDQEKYATVRDLILRSDAPAIVFVARTKRAEEIAAHLAADGINALPYHGQMDKDTKSRNQDSFISGHTQVIVATSAFGMGVDKSDIGLVIHYNISDSLENYLQEAGRAGRNADINADCYVLFNDDDLNKHFTLLNRTKLTLSEINQVWRAIRHLTNRRDTIQLSSLEIARQAGWDDNSAEVDTKVKSALAALENAGYISRGMNSPRIFATAILPSNFDGAASLIDKIVTISENDRIQAKRIIKSLIAEKHRYSDLDNRAESRIDYLSDILGIDINVTIRIVEEMRQNGILSQDNDMIAVLKPTATRLLDYFIKIESWLLDKIDDRNGVYDIKQINEELTQQAVKRANVKDIRLIIIFWKLMGYIDKDTHHANPDKLNIRLLMEPEQLHSRLQHRIALCRFALSKMMAMPPIADEIDFKKISFSFAQMLEQYNSSPGLVDQKADIPQLQEALLYMSKMGVITLEEGFMVLYNKLTITRKSHKMRFLKDDYRALDEFYSQRIRQIHIVGEFANMILRDYDAAMAYVNDYFSLPFEAFISKYFSARRQHEISLNISPQRYREVFGDLTPTQRKVITDFESRFIVVAAGPGSGKTFMLVRKLASLLYMEDVKPERLLMLTFSRAAATEFKLRLRRLIGTLANYVEITTFHSYCFDILGKPGTLDTSVSVVADAVEEIRQGRVDPLTITKSILVIDEAQDMSADEYNLVKALISRNDDMRVIAVGDDDQNIFAFRGADSRYLSDLISNPDYKAASYDMVDNFRSCRQVIDVANSLSHHLHTRLKRAPIVPTGDTEGTVRFTRHTSKEFARAIADEINMMQPSGTTAVLTWTNEDALLMCTHLRNAGLSCRLINADDSFSLTRLAELYWFVNRIKQSTTGLISDDVWAKTIRHLGEVFADSDDLPTALAALQAFANVNTTRYLSDLEQYLHESSASDFDSGAATQIIVSTIHKSKGREYDNVFIFIKTRPQIDDDYIRALYVGFTRAKRILSVHSALDFSSYINTQSATFITDDNAYAETNEIVDQLGYKDVVLDLFKDRTNVVQALRSGAPLYVEGDYLSVSLPDSAAIPVAKMSEAYCAKARNLKRRGFVPTSAKVRHVVYWTYEEAVADKEPERITIPIILPDITYRRP